MSAMPASRIAAPLALLLSLALAGCIQGDGPMGTAMAADRAALPRAQAWHADAALAWAQTFEVARVPPEAAGDEAFRLANDSRPGDGFAGAWFLVYVSPAAPEEAMAFTVLANGTIAHAEPFSRRNQTGGIAFEFRAFPARDWRVDSNQAAATAGQNATWARLAPRATAASFALYGGNGTNPVWVAGITNRDLQGPDNETQGEGAEVYIDATTGALRAERPAWLGDIFGISFGGPGGAYVPAEQGAFEGTLTAVQPQASHEFDLAPGHPSLVVRVAQNPPVPGQRLAITVTGPDGATAKASAAGAEGRVAIDAPAAGTWTVAVALDGAASRYQGCWQAQDSLSVSPELPLGLCG